VTYEFRPEESFGTKWNDESGRQSSPIAKEKSRSSQSDDLTEQSKLPMTAEEFDRRFDVRRERVRSGLWSRQGASPRPGKFKRITVDLPAPFLERLDHWAAVRGMTRQALIKSWLYDRLEKQSQWASHREGARILAGSKGCRRRVGDGKQPRRRSFQSGIKDLALPGFS
jgi:hypothetical protein